MDRLKLHNILLKIMGNRNVYFQAPGKEQMNYPAIVYKRDDIKNTFACDEVYKQDHVFKITLMVYDPDSELINKISKLPKTKFVTHYSADGLNHYVFTIY